MEKAAQEKSFLSFYDAFDWMDQTIWDWQVSGWDVDEGSTLRHVNGGWQVFLQFKKVT